MLSWAHGHRSEESPGGERREARGVIKLASCGDPGLLWVLGWSMHSSPVLCSQSSRFDTSSVFSLLQDPAQPLSFRASRGKLEWNEIHFTERVLHRKCSVLRRKCSGHLVCPYLALATLWRELRDRAGICNPALPLNVWEIWGKLLNFSELWFPSL